MNPEAALVGVLVATMKPEMQIDATERAGQWWTVIHVTGGNDSAMRANPEGMHSVELADGRRNWGD